MLLGEETILYYDAPTGERKKEMIDHVARYFVDNDLDSIGILFLTNFKSLGYLGSQFAIGTLSPFLMLFEDYEKSGYQLIRLFEDKKNIEELIERIEELKEKKNKIDETKKEIVEEKKTGIKSYLLRIWRALF